MSIPHFAFPFRVDEYAAVIEQDSHEEIEQNVKVLVSTEIGERLEVPEFGIPDPTFRTGFDIDAIAEAAGLWDNRSRLIIDQDLSEMVRNVRIQVEER